VMACPRPEPDSKPGQSESTHMTLTQCPFTGTRKHRQMPGRPNLLCLWLCAAPIEPGEIFQIEPI